MLPVSAAVRHQVSASATSPRCTSSRPRPVAAAVLPDSAAVRHNVSALSSSPRCTSNKPSAYVSGSTDGLAYEDSPVSFARNSSVYSSAAGMISILPGKRRDLDRGCWDGWGRRLPDPAVAHRQRLLKACVTHDVSPGDRQPSPEVGLG